MWKKRRRILSGILAATAVLSMLPSGIRIYGKEAGQQEQTELYRYITFYDAETGDRNSTVGFHVKELESTQKDGYIETVVNDHPEWLAPEETDGYPRVILDHGMNQGRQTDITGECAYDADTGIMRIPDTYRGEFLTVKCVLSSRTAAYRMLVPEEYRVRTDAPAPLYTAEGGPTSEQDWALFGVLDGSCNDAEAKGDLSSYEPGDRIPVESALIQTVARNGTDGEGTLDLYGELGIEAYRTGFGWTGFAVSLDCGEGSPFTNIGNPGTGDTVRNFPGIGEVALGSRNWMYARCVTEDADLFSGNGKYTGGHIRILGKEETGALTCWMYLERTGPSGEAAQNVGMVFRIRPSAGSLEIRKSSALPELTEGNASYSLAGAEYTVYPAGTDEEAGRIITDETGYGRLDGLLSGEYEIVETRPPAGYLTDTERHTVTVPAGSTAVCTCSDMPGTGSVDILLVKRDAETGSAGPGLTLEGAEYTVNYFDGIFGGDPEAEGKKPKYTWVFRTDSDGVIRFREEYRVSGDPLLTGPSGEPALPAGTVTIRETAAPEGYLTDQQVYSAVIGIKDGKEVVVSGLPDSETEASKEQVIRGDMELRKIDGENGKAMAGIPFLLTRTDTGESHRLLTDSQGYCSTSSAFAPHSRNTNRGELSSDGVWFGGGEPDDSRGALPYGDYYLEEQLCEANRGKDPAALYFTVSEEGVSIDLGAIRNHTVKLQTSARDAATGTRTVSAEKEASVTDTVAYAGLTPGREYRMEGRLTDRETGETLTVGGKPVAAETSFIPEEEQGTVKLEFSFDASGLAGRTLVAFEQLYWEEKLIAVHEDPEDQEQTVYIPEIRTSARDSRTDSRVGSVREDAVIVDTVSYRGLTPGEPYEVRGILMDRETGEEVQTDGGSAEASLTFIPDSPEGAVRLEIPADASELAGRSVTVFETILYQGRTVAFHRDLQDEEQTVHYPQLKTKASAYGKQEAAAGDEVLIQDEVSWANLIPGEEYVLQGILMDRDSGQPLLAEGKTVTASQSFIPETGSGKTIMSFAFRADGLDGRTVVVFEELHHNGTAAAAHADLQDEAQSVRLLPEPVVPVPAATPSPEREVPQTGDPAGSLSVLPVVPAAGLTALILWRIKRRRGLGRP